MENMFHEEACRHPSVHDQVPYTPLCHVHYFCVALVPLQRCPRQLFPAPAPDAVAIVGVVARKIHQRLRNICGAGAFAERARNRWGSKQRGGQDRKRVKVCVCVCVCVCATEQLHKACVC